MSRLTRRVAVKAKAAPAPAYDADAQTYFAAMTIQPNDTRKGLIDALIVGLKADGVWSLLDCLWLIASHDSQAGLLNAKSPGSFVLTPAGGPTFVTDRGYLCDGSDDALGSAYNYASSGQHQQNSAHVSGWLNASNNTTSSSNFCSVGSSTNSINTALRPYSNSMTVGGQITGSPVYSSLPSTSSYVGFRLLSRVDSESMLGQAEILQGTVSAVSAAPLSQPLILMQRGSTFLQGRIATASVGGGLTATQSTALYNRLNTYLSAIGAA